MTLFLKCSCFNIVAGKAATNVGDGRDYDQSASNATSPHQHSTRSECQSLLIIRMLLPALTLNGLHFGTLPTKGPQIVFLINETLKSFEFSSRASKTFDVSVLKVDI